MPAVRQPAVAGAFYPKQRQTLSSELAALLRAAAAAAKPERAVPKALIVPHAGLIYSGSTAALAYARLAPARAQIRRVVLLGPAHRLPVRGLALDDADFFATPLGQIEIDQDAVAAIAALPQVQSNAAAHRQEHSLELQLPFLQTVLDHFKLLPLAVGEASAAEVAQVIERLWGGPETLIVVSSDLSHFLPYQEAQAMDQATVQQLLALQALQAHQQACGATPVNGLLLCARQHRMSTELLGLCNSGDTAGDRQRVVGYAAVAFMENTDVH